MLTNRIMNINKSDFADFIMPHISINSNSQAVIDGCKGVIEYTSDLIRINCNNLILKFSGTQLCIKTAAFEQYVVTGNIVSLEFYSC